MLTQIVKGIGLVTLAITAYLAWPVATMIIGLGCIAKGGNQRAHHPTGYGLCLIGALCCIATGIATTPGILLLSLSLSTSTFGIARWILPALFPKTTPPPSQATETVAPPPPPTIHVGASFGHPPVQLTTIPDDLFSRPLSAEDFYLSTHRAEMTKFALSQTTHP